MRPQARLEDLRTPELLEEQICEAWIGRGDADGVLQAFIVYEHLKLQSRMSETYSRALAKHA